MQLYLPIIPNIPKCRTHRKMQMESKIEDLIYYRDNLQIEDKENIQKVLNELIPEYKAEQENKELREIRLSF